MTPHADLVARLRDGLNLLRARVDNNETHLWTCNGDDDGSPCDCGAIRRRDLVDQLLDALAALPPPADPPDVVDGQCSRCGERDGTHAVECRSQAAQAYGYLSRLFKHCAPQCEPLPDLIGICTQIDNLIVGLRQRPADPLTADESAWLIERDIDSVLHYWTGRVIDGREIGAWSVNHLDARRFARREDAACMLTWHCGDVGRVVAHLWMAPRAAPPAAPPEDAPRKAEHLLAASGVFKGHEGLRGLANAASFWVDHPYGTRLYYGDGGMDYLHRDVLMSAVRVLDTLAASAAPPDPPSGQIIKSSDQSAARQSDPPGLVANWRPIETAPKRTDVLAGWADRPHWLPQVLQQDDAGMWFNGEESDYRPPTHWMPLPASPQAETKGDE